jgi:WD40 repeat protein
MSRKVQGDHADEDSEVGDRDRHRRTAQSDHGHSSTSKRLRVNEEQEKEFINTLSYNPENELNRKEKVSGSIELDNLYASLLPTSNYYERSYMHRDVVTHILVTKTDFLITGSQDGHIKFWKIITPDFIKQQQTASTYQSSKTNDDKDGHSNPILPGPIEFVKHFRAHLGIFYLFFSFHLLKSVC